jgi:hypothetical protein
MATTLRQTESAPASYPDAPSGLSPAAAALDPAVIWGRLESYCGRRWSRRSVEWLAEGPGCWFPPLSPAAVETIERWEAAAWAPDDTLAASALGGFVLRAATYRFTGTAGPETPAAPPLVSEAYRRLAEYLAVARLQPGLRQSSVDGIGSETYDAAALGRALDRSGAADLLRAYRRAA